MLQGLFRRCRMLIRCLFDWSPPLTPHILYVVAAGEESSMQFKYTLGFTPAGATDVNERLLTLLVLDPPEPGGPSEVTEDMLNSVEPITLPRETLTYDIVAPAGKRVYAFLVDVDAVGNRSQPSPARDFIAVDVFPPPAPGIVTVTPTGQID